MGTYIEVGKFSPFCYQLIERERGGKTELLGY